MPWCFWTKGGAVSKSPMRCCLTTTRSAAGASSSSNAGSKGSPASMWAGAQANLSVKQEDDLKAWVSAALPRSTRQIGAWIETEFGLVYESRSGLIALLHRLGLEYHKPDVPRKLDEEKQKAFIESYNKLLNSLT